MRKKFCLQLLSLFFLASTNLASANNLGQAVSIQEAARTILVSNAVRKLSDQNLDTRQNLFPGIAGNITVVHIAAVAYSDDNLTLSGVQTIDGVTLVAGDRILLNGQSDATQNGLWVVQSGAWTRPTDFTTGSIAGVAYVLITGGDNYSSTSWVCVTLSAIIGTDDILFAQYATYSRTALGANVGAGTGEIFRDKTGNTLNFRTLAGDDHLTVDTETNIVTLATDATASNDVNTIVLRDGSGDFSARNLNTNMVTLTGTVTNSTDATTKAYVDNLVITGFTVHPAAVVYSADNIVLSGTQTIDDVLLVANDRVLLNGQTTASQNGLWLVQVDAWTRPDDFLSGSTAGNAYVLINSGDIYAGTSWVCDTPTAVIDLTSTTDLITFAQFSPVGQTTAANVGAGAGQIFRNKTGNTLNLKTIVAGEHLTVTNNSDDITLATDATASNDANTIVKRDGSGNFAAGTITATLAGNADTATSASYAYGVETATASNDSNTIVKRNGSGNFSASTITANSFVGPLTGNASTATSATTAGSATSFTGSLVGDVTGTQGATVVSYVGGAESGVSQAQIITGVVSANNATASNTINQIVVRDGSGNFAAGTITANSFVGPLTGNASTATSATSATDFTGDLAGDVTGTQGATVVSYVGGAESGVSQAQIITGVVSANNATASNTINQIVVRNGSGDFAAGTITANSFVGPLTGNASTATSAGSATDFTGDLVGDVTGTQGATVVSYVGGAESGVSQAQIISGVVSANNATASNTPSEIVKRNGSGNFSAGTITANSFVGPLTGNASTATSATSATSFTGSLAGDVTGTQGATVVSYVGGAESGVSQAQIISGVTVANNATNANTANTIVKRNGSGNFSAGTITANSFVGPLTGNASTATSATTAGSATSFTGSLIGDVTGTQSATVVSYVGGQTAENIAATVVDVAAATDLNTPSEIVKRNGSGNFAAGTITANNFVGPLTGNASTATSATSATTAGSATSFTGSLVGDVTGTQGATVVSYVGGAGSGVSQAQIISGVNKANAATSNDENNKIVLRNGSGNFTTNMITLNGTVSNSTDAATKSYVDTAVSTGFVVHPAALVYSANNITLSGTQTIDGVSLAADNRVLLNGQTTASENGLWLVQVGAWTRPTDFASGSTAGSAYVLIESGTVFMGTSWVCDTPTAVINTNPISFAQFSSADQTTAANVGSGAGQIFRDKTGNIINLKTVAAGEHLTVTNNTDDITLATDATASNINSTLVARDGLGDFAAGTVTANLTGAASANVLKTGDTMTGILNLTTQSAVRWQDASDGEYVGIRAPATIGTSYTLDLPASAPIAKQFLQATTASTLDWTDIGGTPTTSKTYYVTLNGSDSTGNGSFSAPYRTIKQAVSIANPLVSAADPITINIGSGIFLEDNSGGSINISNDGLSLVGSSILGTVIQPTTDYIDLFNCTTSNVTFSNFTIDASNLITPSTASAITLNTDVPGIGRFQSLVVQQFFIGFNLSSTTGVPILRFNNVQPRANTTAFVISNSHVALQNSIVLGPSSGVTTPTNMGINVTGSYSVVETMSTLFRLLDTAISSAGGASVYNTANNFEHNNNGLAISGGSNATITGCNFLFNTASSINIAVSGSDTMANITSCEFMCQDSVGVNRGTAIQVTAGAEVHISSCAINGAVTGLQCGTSGDTNSTMLHAHNAVVLDNCTTDINQVAASNLHFIGGTFDITKTIIADSTNVSFAAFDRNGDDVLSVGDTVDNEQTIYQVLNGQAILPVLNYESSYYGSKGTVYKNSNSDATFNGTQAASNNASYYVITGDNTKTAGVNLISDTSTIGTSDNVRGWNINKAGTSAGLGFTYSNNDSSDQAERGANAVINLNGFDNQVEFPTAANTPLPTNTVAKLVWAGDTNLYRSATDTLKTDDNLIVGDGVSNGSLTVNSLTANRVVTTDGSKILASSATTATELGYLSGATSSIQTQLDSKLPLAGGTMTGTLTTQDLTVAVANNLTVNSLNASRAIATNGSKQLVASATTATELGYVAGATSSIQTQLDSKLPLAGGTVTGNLTVNGLTVSRAMVTDGSKQLTSSTTTATELGYLSGASSSIQTQLDSKLPLAGGTLTGTLNTANLVVGGNETVNSLTANRVVTTDDSKILASSATTATELGYVAGATSSIQTQLDSKLPLAGGTMTGTLTTQDLTVAVANNLTVNSLNASRAIATNSSKQLVASATTATELGYVAGATSSIQTQLDSKLSLAGGTLTGTLNTANLVVGGNETVNSLTANRVVTTDGSKILASSATTTTELGYLSGTTSSIQTQLDSKLSKSGGTMTGALTTQDLIVATAHILCNQSIVRVVPLTGNTVVIANTTAILILQPAATINTINLTFPTIGLTDGQMLTISTTANITNVNYTAGPTINSPVTAFTNNVRSVNYIYYSGTGQWYRI